MDGTRQGAILSYSRSKSAAKRAAWIAGDDWQ
jgi:hypothetical protein